MTGCSRRRRPDRLPECLHLSSITGLFETWYPRLVRSVRNRVESTDDAEDVAQEAFVRLLGESPRDSRAWLFTVADRLAIDHRRARARRERLAARPSVLAHTDDSESAPDHRLLRDERVDSVRRVLRLLRARDRQLLLLYHAGLSYREIATQLGVAPSSIGSLLTRAHRRFLARYNAPRATPLETADEA